MRIEPCQKNLAKFKEGKWRLSDVITRDESWFYFRQIGHKSSNKSLVAKGEYPPKIVLRDSLESKACIL